MGLTEEQQMSSHKEPKREMAGMPISPISSNFVDKLLSPYVILHSAGTESSPNPSKINRSPLVHFINFFYSLEPFTAQYSKHHLTVAEFISAESSHSRLLSTLS